jgi:hypothetical protein
MAKGLKRVILAGVGGLVALLALLFVVGAVIGFASAKGAIDPKAGMPIVMGTFALMLLMTVSYSIAWAIWWWRHR